MSSFAVPAYVLPDYVDEQDATLQSLTQPQPALGAPVQYRAVGDAVDVPVAIMCTFTTSAGVGDRYPDLILRQQDLQLLAEIPSPQPQPASTSYRYGWHLATTQVIATGAGVIVLPLVPLPLLAGYSLQVNALGLQAGDQFGVSIFTLARYPTSRRRPAELLSGPLALSALGAAAG